MGGCAGLLTEKVERTQHQIALVGDQGGEGGGEPKGRVGGWVGLGWVGGWVDGGGRTYSSLVALAGRGLKSKVSPKPTVLIEWFGGGGFGWVGLG